MVSKKKYTEMLVAHEKELVKRYGRKRAMLANVGWYSDKTSISSKVYPLTGRQDTVVFTTVIRHGVITHWEDDYKV